MKRLITICAVTVLVLAVSSAAEADVTRLSDSAVFATIQAAIDDAGTGAGETLNVADGTYTITAAINVNKGVTITGNIANPENVLVKYNPASSTLNCVELNSADVTIQGIKVQDCRNGFHFDRNVNTNTGVTISNCIIENVSGWGIGEISSPNTAINHNTIINAGDKGVYFRKCEGTSESNRCEAISNVISGCGQSAIQTYFSKYAYIYDNTISSTNDKGINIIRSGATGTADSIQVIGNTITGTKWPGIQVIGAPYTYVYSNTLTKCNYYGGDGTGDWDYASIHVQDDGAVSGDHVVINSNTVSDGINGIQLWSDNCTITNNTIYDMGKTYADTKTTADGVYHNSAILYGDMYNVCMPTSATISCNNIYGNCWGLFVNSVYTGTVTAELNWWGDNSGPFHLTTNPGGLGDAVSDYVLYDPWTLHLIGFGFEPPMDKGTVMVKKNRVLPLKAELLDGQYSVTDVDITAPPVLQVMFSSSGTEEAVDVTDQVLSAGQGTDGNKFEFNVETGVWQFNLKTKNYSAKGTYTITMVSADECEYVIEPTCTAKFVIK